MGISANELEVLYAVALDRGVVDDLPMEYRSDADETVTRLEAMLEQLSAVPEDGLHA